MPQTIHGINMLAARACTRGCAGGFALCSRYLELQALILHTRHHCWVAIADGSHNGGVWVLACVRKVGRPVVMRQCGQSGGENGMGLAPQAPQKTVELSAAHHLRRRP